VSGESTRKGPDATLVGTDIRIVCFECRRETVHQVIRSAEYMFTWTDGSHHINAWEVFQILECRGCENLGFRKVHTDTEATYHDPDTGDEHLEEREELFPSRVGGRAEIDQVWMLPPQVQAIYRETLMALSGGMRALAGIGLRAIVEATCNERGAKGKDLEKRIDDLVTQQVLTPEGAKVLHSLRVMGNLAAHEIVQHAIDQLNTAMEVVDHLLLGVYVIPKLASELPQPKP
jgi:hypothetical protein